MRTCMRISKVSFSVFYIIIVPLIMPAGWCLNALEDERGHLPRNGIFLACGKVSAEQGIPYSRVPMATPSFIAASDILCLLIFSFIKGLQYKRRNPTRYIKYRELVFSILVLVSLVDIIYCLVRFEHQWLSNLLRPIVFILLYRSQQDFFVDIGLNIKDSSAMLLCIFVWVAYFAAIGNFLFGNIMEGIMLFDTFANSFWAMFVCLTTENFPDVMLFAQQENAAYSLFFIVFILVGVFFLLSVLLAVIFDNFKNRVELSQKDNIAERLEYIEYFFAQYDDSDKGWLTVKETKAFFAHVLDLSYKKPSHNRMMTKIFLIVDPANSKEILKENILRFFEISGF